MSIRRGWLTAIATLATLFLGHIQADAKDLWFLRKKCPNQCWPHYGYHPTCWRPWPGGWLGCPRFLPPPQGIRPVLQLPCDVCPEAPAVVPVPSTEAPNP
jgi:hypothetical protein